MKIDLTPIKEHSYTYEEGFTLCSKKPAREGGMRQIDWDTVKAILETEEFDRVEVGLAEDYNCTHAIIYIDGEVAVIENKEGGFFGSSRWATPAVKVYQNSESELYECWVNGDMSDFPKWLLEMEVL